MDERPFPVSQDEYRTLVSEGMSQFAIPAPKAGRCGISTLYLRVTVRPHGSVHYDVEGPKETE